ncbi:hypothetical protein EBU71_16285 [bacterium]|nr:hypothetical protein [Candidatus Elulimicrobium humile]
MTNIITFTDTIGIPDEYKPVPADSIIPHWYKNLTSYVGGEKRTDGNAGTTATAKRCMPMFDAISAGYIIFTHADLYISQKFDEETGKDQPYYEWANFGALDFHPIHQLPAHPDNSGHEVSYPKWINAWAIKTPPGYSTLFIPPIHRETPITALSGLVDTDTYSAPVNFPFVLKDPKMDGIIPAGTPIIQVIPIKRESWQMQEGNNQQYIEQQKTRSKLRSKFFDSYKNQYRQIKEYK